MLGGPQPPGVVRRKWMAETLFELVGISKSYPGVMALGYAAWVAWLLGFPNGARRHSRLEDQRLELAAAGAA